MKIYSSEIADMKVSLFSNGLDNIVRKLSYEFMEDAEWEDSDILLVLSHKEDKNVESLFEKIEKEGKIATLVIEVLTEDASSKHEFIDLCVKAREQDLVSALKDTLTLLDYYNYIKPVDVGYELSKRGAVTYVDLGYEKGLATSFSDAGNVLIGREKALMLLEAGEDVFMSDIDLLADELSEKSGDTKITLSAVRTLSGDKTHASLFITK